MRHIDQDGHEDIHDEENRSLLRSLGAEFTTICNTIPKTVKELLSLPDDKQKEVLELSRKRMEISGRIFRELRLHPYLKEFFKEECPVAWETMNNVHQKLLRAIGFDIGEENKE